MILSFISILAASQVQPSKPVDTFQGWTCTYTSLAQQSDERDGRSNNGSATVRVCTPPKAGK